MTLKVLHVCFTDAQEGAAIGAHRLHSAMLKCGVDSRLLVYRKKTRDATVYTLNFFTRLRIFVYRYLTRWLLNLEQVPGSGVRSLNLFPTGAHREINKSDADIVQLHWINHNTIGISEIPKIKKPIVWKLPDMWAFSGAAHYVLPEQEERYTAEGFKRARNANGRGLDIEKWLMLYKRRCWRDRKFTIVTPSRWLGECAAKSMLFGHYRIANIPNPIDVDRYLPIAKSEARKLMRLDPGKKYILFGGINAAADERKGYKHLEAALEHLRAGSERADLELMVMGSRGPEDHDVCGYKVRFLGNLVGDTAVCVAYNAADLAVLPTLADNLPNVIQEAMSCGVPCVGFDVGGMPDMIRHRETGYLARPFSSADLAEGIIWTLEQDTAELSRRVRASAEKLHSPVDRVNDYLQLYQEVLEAEKGPGAC